MTTDSDTRSGNLEGSRKIPTQAKGESQTMTFIPILWGDVPLMKFKTNHASCWEKLGVFLKYNYGKLIEKWLKNLEKSINPTR